MNYQKTSALLLVVLAINGLMAEPLGEKKKNSKRVMHDFRAERVDAVIEKHRISRDALIETARKGLIIAAEVDSENVVYLIDDALFSCVMRRVIFFDRARALAAIKNIYVMCLKARQLLSLSLFFFELREVCDQRVMLFGFSNEEKDSLLVSMDQLRVFYETLRKSPVAQASQV